ncbi:MAG: tRNA guanosine(34) transglycosylase Tgt [Chitinophagia bacterium]|nr:tRNA guanosine(34) transglycosylase Tgt [Chitinophagia bacterium]
MEGNTASQFRYGNIFETATRCPDTKARAGVLTLPHGTIQTPIFMPVGTVGSVKAVTHALLTNEIGAPLILGNTYHLYLRPGTDVITQGGGLHKFSSWNGALLTDSGGYQVFSLAEKRKIKEEGVMFQSHIDGSRHLFTPEKVIDIQRAIGADIIMAFDECPPYPSEYSYALKSMELTHRWLDRCRQQLDNTAPLYGYPQYLFPIVQGSTYKDLRQRSAEYIANAQCSGNAIGGLSVGEPEQDMYEMCSLCTDILPQNKPRYLMGVGTPWNILECIALGVDMFDCVMPTRNGRNGMLFTENGIINIKNKKWATDYSPIDEELCPTSRQYSKAYLRHLFIAGEILAMQIASIHNLAFYLYLVKQARKHIMENTFFAWKQKMVNQLKQRL